jgi:hypothetical protein
MISIGISLVIMGILFTCFLNIVWENIANTEKMSPIIALAITFLFLLPGLIIIKL